MDISAAGKYGCYWLLFVLGRFLTFNTNVLS